MVNQVNTNYDIVNKFQNAMFYLKSEELEPLFAENVIFELSTNANNEVINGKKAVIKFFKENFFDITSNISVKNAEIRAQEINPTHKFMTTEDRSDKKYLRRIRLKGSSTFQIDFDDGTPKIGKLISKGTSRTLCSLKPKNMFKVVEQWQNLASCQNMSVQEKKSIADKLLSRDCKVELTCICEGEKSELTLGRDEFLNGSITNIFNNVKESKDDFRKLTIGDLANTVVFNESTNEFREGKGLGENGNKGWYHFEGYGVYTLKMEDDGIKICHYKKLYTKHCFEKVD